MKPVSKLAVSEVPFHLPAASHASSAGFFFLSVSLPGFPTFSLACPVVRFAPEAAAVMRGSVHLWRSVLGPQDGACSALPSLLPWQPLSPRCVFGASHRVESPSVPLGSDASQPGTVGILLWVWSCPVHCKMFTASLTSAHPYSICAHLKCLLTLSSGLCLVQASKGFGTGSMA